MSATYVYAVVSDPPTSAESLATDDLRVLTHGGLAAVVRTIPTADLAGTPDAITDHAAIVERLYDDQTTLPVRFGVVLDGDDDVVDQLLRQYEHELHQLLDEMADCVEFRVRARYDRDALLRLIVASDAAVRTARHQVSRRASSAGHAAQLQLGELVAAAIERQQAEDASHIVRALASTSIRSRTFPSPPEMVALHAAFLVQSCAVDDFTANVEAATESASGPIATTLVGPVPPWDFVELRGGTG